MQKQKGTVNLREKRSDFDKSLISTSQSVDFMKQYMASIFVQNVPKKQMHICETWQRAKYTVIVYKSCGELYLIVKYTDYGHAMKAYIYFKNIWAECGRQICF